MGVASTRRRFIWHPAERQAPATTRRDQADIAQDAWPGIQS